ncbi:MAG: hypothetical protein ABSA21_13860 [Candidatus Limnocylindrales bacterium]
MRIDLSGSMIRVEWHNLTRFQGKRAGVGRDPADHKIDDQRNVR